MAKPQKDRPTQGRYSSASKRKRKRHHGYGINVGALTVKVVALRGYDRIVRVKLHLGRPFEVLQEILAGSEFAGTVYVGVSGYLGHLTEAPAIQRGLREMQHNFDAVVSLGGESFLVYLVTDVRITHVLPHNKCAGRSGEFLVQQIGRMGLGLEEAIRRSFDGKVVPLASRSSVHCKSDITHKLNRNESTPEDILHTLHDGMAGKVTAPLEKAQRVLKRMLLIGRVTRNAAMLAALREKQPATEFEVSRIVPGSRLGAPPYSPEMTRVTDHRSFQSRRGSANSHLSKSTMTAFE